MSSHKAKKRKLGNDDGRAVNVNKLDTSKPTAVFTATKGHLRRTSLVVRLVFPRPGPPLRASPEFSEFLSHLFISGTANENSAGTRELKTVLAGQIARACAVFCVDEVVVFDDGAVKARPPDEDGYTGYTDPNNFLVQMLTYLETPPHLRRTLIPKHADFQCAGVAPSLDMPHHLRSDEWCIFREGVALHPGENRDGNPGTLVDCGLQQKVFVGVPLEERSRVTVKLPDQPQAGRQDMLHGEAVSPDTPREEAGYYWGYSVRQASSLGAVFTECQYDGGYDISIGTSERGMSVQSVLSADSVSCVQPTWQHLLIVFGGVAGLEAALSADAELQAAGVSEAKEVFDRWLNVLPQQGSRTIRTEEATWIALTSLRPLMEARAEAA
ncbi:hypothetical protein BAUCODRAFT_23290 [Baudoinia panamericana UAMH 10762]|uniref:DUF171-domain-containing protein n=1 Tax=Baudoinia panamericana (strain UAMH 10762) TaxID=717646 RepID=M2NGW6_BAUPA|nr:uncharacterized protein BAUCODRAFT_23290 [Baudoinia panamericana UAMH 10762]EMC98544.1 hypothetical protein BAUCODRAFT_23290 [Baudoinia panamericana UAMH 10762]